jgi:NADP oxidoreductase coenzyme F420-dependent
VLSNSQGPDSLAGLVSELGPRASAATPVEAAETGDFAIVAIPLTTIDQVPVELLAEKVVIATINYFPQRLGHVPEIDDGTITAPGLLQAHLPASKVVRAFSMIDAADMSGDGIPRVTRSAGRWRWPGGQAASSRAVQRVRLRRAGHRRPVGELADRRGPARLRRPPEPGRAHGQCDQGQAR